MSSTPERFKNNFMALVEICEELVQDGHELGVTSLTPVMFSIIRIMISKFSGEYLMERFIVKTHKHWGRIKERDFEYFKGIGSMLMGIASKEGSIDSMVDEQDTIVSGLKVDHITMFKDLLAAEYCDDSGNMVSLLDDERVTDTWRIMHSFVKQSIAYIFEQRCVVDGEFTKDFFPQVNVREQALEWNMRKFI